MTRRQSKPRRGQGDGSIYQRASDGRWLGVVDLGAGGGKVRTRKTVSAKTRAEVVRKMRALHRQIDAGVLPDNVTTGQWLTYWLDEIVAPSPNIRERTLIGYRSYVTTWLDPHLGRIPLQQLTPDHVRALYRVMRKAGRSEATIRQAHAILHRALKIALNEGRTVRNAADLGVDGPRAKRNPTPHLDATQSRRVLAAAQDTRELARLSVALLLGLRQGEALGLRWEHVDLEHKLMRVEQAVQRRAGQGLVVTDVKSTTSHRTIPLPDALAAILRGWKGESGGTGWVFPGHDPGNPSDPRRDWQAWKDALARAGVPHVPLKGARASTASLLTDLGVPLRTVADILGHAESKVTDLHYAHSSEGARRDALNALETLALTD